MALLHNSASTSSNLGALAPLANEEDDECSDAGVYYSSTLSRGSVIVLDSNQQLQSLTLTVGGNNSDSLITGDSVDSGAFTTISSSTSTQFSDVTTSSGIASCQQQRQLHNDDEDDEDIEAGFGERNNNSSDEDLTRNKMPQDSTHNNNLTRHRSLEALVNSFDECLNAALGDMARDVTHMAPVTAAAATAANNNLSTQEELVSDDPLWLHLTQSDSARLSHESIDWSQSMVREQLLLPALRMARHHHQNRLENTDEIACNVAANNKTDAIHVDEEADDGFAELCDMHSLAGLYNCNGEERSVTASYKQTGKLQTADEVIEEIDKILNECVPDNNNNNSSSSQNNEISAAPPTSYMNNNNLFFDEDEQAHGNLSSSSDKCYSASAAAVANVLNEIEEKLKSMPIPLYEDKLNDLSIPDLIELMADLDKLTQQFSEILVHELALRDELQFEKEIKNTFITLVLRVQNQRKESENAERVNKRRRNAAAAAAASAKLLLKSPTTPFSPTKPTTTASLLSPSTWTNSILPSPLAPVAVVSQASSLVPSTTLRYLSTAIPYQPGVATTLRHLQAIIKILRAMSENSPTTTTLLTDYILNVLCPKE